MSYSPVVLGVVFSRLFHTAVMAAVKAVYHWSITTEEIKIIIEPHSSVLISHFHDKAHSQITIVRHFSLSKMKSKNLKSETH